MNISGIERPQSPQSHAESFRDISNIPEKQQESDFIDSLMISKDKDSDGVLSLKESGLRRKKFAEFDYDGDGRITASEVEAHFEQKAHMGKLTVAMGQEENFSAGGADEVDSNMVSFEASGLDKNSFSQADSDGDGFISKDDLGAESLADKAEDGSDAASAFSDAFSKFKKKIFAGDDEKRKDDLDRDGEVTAAERKISVGHAGEMEDVDDETGYMSRNTGKKSSARQMAGIRAYQNQSGVDV